MSLNTPGGIRAAIEQEVRELSGASGGDREVILQENEIDDLIRAVSDIPADQREVQMREMVNDIVQRRLGDPRD